VTGHLAITIYVDVHNRAYDLLPEDMDNDQRVELADAIVSFAYEHAVLIAAAVEGQAEAERVLGDAIAKAWRTGDLDGLLPARREEQP